MKTVTWTNASSVADVLNQAEQEEVVILRDGRPVAIVAPFDEDDLAWFAHERKPAFIQSIARARTQVAAGETVSQEDLRRELGM
jgi:antitoxin (DNA-binding transcriptional repressor) of toxin-antitoxin stability system